MKIFNPIKTEAMMEELRVAREFSEVQEVERIVDELNHTSNDVKKLVTKINPLAIHIPNWQRNCNMDAVNEIAENYDDLKFEAIKVIIVNEMGTNKIYVAEGQHRSVGTAKRGMKLIPVEVLKCTEREARDLFLQQGIIRKNPSLGDTWRASIANEDPRFTKVKAICDNYNFAIKYDDNHPTNPIGILSSVGDYTGGLKATEPRISLGVLKSTLKLLTELGWCASNSSKKATTTSMLRAIAMLYAHTPKNKIKRMENRLVEELGSVEAFETQVITKNWRFYFDVLADAINREDEIVDKFVVHNNTKTA